MVQLRAPKRIPMAFKKLMQKAMPGEKRGGNQRLPFKSLILTFVTNHTRKGTKETTSLDKVSFQL
jgi:hypothetical protein